MILCAAGDIHGALHRLYEDDLAFEVALGVRFEWVLHVGDFDVWPDPNRIDGAGDFPAWVLHVGDFDVWPDPNRIDSATKRHNGAGDFPAWCAERREAPRKTLFIKGNHKDFVWLDAQPDSEVLPNLFYLRNGSTFDLDGIVVGGVGGRHGPSDYGRRSKDLQGYAKRHHTREDIDRLIAKGRVDLLLTHDAPAGVVFPRHRRGFNRPSEAMGLDDLVRGVRPSVCFFGHHHTRFDSHVDGVPCIGLNKVRMPGNLLAVEMPERGRDWTVLGEWPQRA